MDLQLRPLARVSAVSGAPFELGESVVCYLYRDADGQLTRDDMRLEEEAGYTPPNQVMARWTREVKSAGEEEREARRQVLETAEDLFVALCEEGEKEEQGSGDRDALKQILALMLERKRLLRPLSRRGSAQIRYLHVRSQKEYSVQSKDLTVEEAVRIQQDLQQFVL